MYQNMACDSDLNKWKEWVSRTLIFPGCSLCECKMCKNSFIATINDNVLSCLFYPISVALELPQVKFKMTITQEFVTIHIG